MEAQEQRCVYTGDLIDAGGHKKYTASLDRISSDDGYTLDNVMFVKKEVNYAKHVLSEKDFLELVGKIYSHRMGGKCI